MTAPDELAAMLDAALAEALEAVRAALAAGGKPGRHRQPELSFRDNGMPSMSDVLFAADGPLDHSNVLDPPYDADPDVRRAGKYPASRFPRVAELKAFATREVETFPAFRQTPGPLLDIHVQLMIDRLVDSHAHRFGDTPSTVRSRELTLRPWLAPLHAEHLAIALVTPVALVGFEADRFRIDDRAFIVRMSPELQRARWSGKAYGANGHDSVLAAATHAFVLTGWRVDNTGSLDVFRALSRHADDAREAIERLFAALRLITGVETGYAQEIRLARGWRLHQRHGWPEIVAAGARRYPEGFDDFGWMRESLPHVTRTELRKVAETYRLMRTVKQSRFDIALRRFNAAMTRHDPADGLLDAAIALEILLGDDSQAVSWKLRMRAGAVVGCREPAEAVKEVFDGVKATYEARSAIVHGSSARGKRVNVHEARGEAVDLVRRLLVAALRDPQFLDPKRIDEELLLGL